MRRRWRLIGLGAVRLVCLCCVSLLGYPACGRFSFAGGDDGLLLTFLLHCVQAIKASNIPRGFSLGIMLGTGWSSVFECGCYCWFEEVDWDVGHGCGC